MPEVKNPTTQLTSQYAAQVTGDLERNTKEQDRIGGEIQALQEQLAGLQHDHTVLVNLRQALGGASPDAQEAGVSVSSVPHQGVATTKSGKPKKTATTNTKTTTSKKTSPKQPASKPSPASASSAKASKPATGPTLVEVIRVYLKQQSEPRSAAEITTGLAQAHPERTVKATVVRTTLEGLVAKNHAQRKKQGSSVFYTAVDAQEPAAAAKPQQEPEVG
ncbi:BlaI/MecI/CopY family transcriptional regulator [Streptomyces sp. NBC_01462]|uniref:BlaI/MecI/CopY family transcriptional regulator n=1 Tax=Streptomyces sp. NBC_01462 TaxID=2903876 RepID=UPI002E31F63B|nr:BlaI/MecI/CopY family transcriptional regulator [Streptomyces sp. NBC_01462]